MQIKLLVCEGDTKGRDVQGKAPRRNHIGVHLVRAIDFKHESPLYLHDWPVKSSYEEVVSN